MYEADGQVVGFTVSSEKCPTPKKKRMCVASFGTPQNTGVTEWESRVEGEEGGGGREEGEITVDWEIFSLINNLHKKFLC